MTLGVWLAAAAAWLGLLAFFRAYRIWVIYYAVGAVGLAFLLIFGGATLIPAERALEMLTAYSAHFIGGALGIPTQVFEAAPGNILVWVVAQNPGWTVVRVDLECSGLLELAVLTGLLLFYPAWTWPRRLGWIAGGWLATMAANVVRVLSIILMLHLLGKRAIFVAHTIVGRLIFFVLTAAFYWLVFTRGTLDTLAERLEERLRT